MRSCASFIIFPDFSIDPVSGVIRTRTVLKYESRSTYALTVVVRDLGLPPLETIQEYRVEVVELDDSVQQTTTRSKFTFEVKRCKTMLKVKY